MIIVTDEWTLMALVMITFIFSFIPTLVFLWRTPAMKFLKASFGGKAMLWNPTPSRIGRFIPIKRDTGALAQTDKFGFYETSPHDFWIEEKSKVPIALTYSNHGQTINPVMAEIADKLKTAHNIKTFRELFDFWDKNYREKDKELMINLGPILTEKEIKYLTDFMKDYMKHPNPEKLMITHNKTVPLSEVVEYFAYNKGSDMIESEVQRRNIAEKKKTQGDLVRWIIVLGVFLICAAVAMYIFSLITPAAPAGPSPEAYADAVANAINQKVITGTTIN